jgi:hypothetical protein
MLGKTLALSALLWASSIPCYSDSFTYTDTNSGQLNNEGYFEYEVEQTIYYQKGLIHTESHSFIFHGALLEDNYPTLLGMDRKWLIYEGKKHYIAIPCAPDEGVYVLDKSLSPIPSPGRPTPWQRISKPKP